MELEHNKYKISDKKIGSGGFSEVFIGTDIDTGEIVAVKRVSLTQKNLQEEQTLLKLSAEIELMQTLDHPNIVKYYDVVKTQSYWYIIMEYCHMGTFQDVIKYNQTISNYNDRESNSYYYLDQLKDALNYLRKKGCIHRDIKPVNILLTKEIKYGKKTESDIIENNNMDISYNSDSNLIVKLADFGLAKSCLGSIDSLMNTICGSPLYMAPELFFQQRIQF